MIRSRGRSLHFELEGAPAAKPEAAPVPEVLTDAEMKELERGNLRAALELCDGKISGPGGAAELLGVRPTTLAYRIRKLGLRR